MPGSSVKSLQIAIIAVAAGFGLWSCAGVTPATKAAAVEQTQCDSSTSAENETRVLEGATVLAVEPVYSYVHTATTGTDKRVAGAKLLIRPPEGIDAERVLRIIQCHSARAVLGRVDASKFPDDPYWLEGAWLAIDLVPESGNLSVTVQAEDIHKNLQVLARARAFAARSRLRSAPPPAPHRG